MSLKLIIAAALILAVLTLLPACASGPKDFPLPLPDTDLKVVEGQCGPEFKGKAKGTTDIAIGDTGWRWKQTTTNDNHIYRPCKPPQGEPASRPTPEEIQGD